MKVSVQSSLYIWSHLLNVSHVAVNSNQGEVILSVFIEAQG